MFHDLHSKSMTFQAWIEIINFMTFQVLCESFYFGFRFWMKFIVGLWVCGFVVLGNILHGFSVSNTYAALAQDLALQQHFTQMSSKFSENSNCCINLLFKVTMHVQTDHFFEILIFRLMYRSTHELSSKKKILKNIK